MKVFNKNGNEVDLLTSTEVASIGNLIVPKNIGSGSVNDLTSTGIYVLQDKKVSDTPVISNGVLLVFNPYIYIIIKFRFMLIMMGLHGLEHIGIDGMRGNNLISSHALYF